MQIEALIERLEKLDGPDRKTDALIWAYFAGVRYKWHNPIDDRAETQVGFTEPPRRVELVTKDRGPHHHAQPVTVSLDAAIALVEKTLPGCQWTIEPDACWLRVLTENDVDEFQGHLNGRNGKCTAIALCLALLRALQSGGRS